jgi:hypothetical protein
MNWAFGRAKDDSRLILATFKLMDDKGLTRYAASRVVARAVTADHFEQRALARRLDKKVAALQAKAQ